MCGIAFVLNYGNKKLDLDRINEMWKDLSIRGTDSAGYYFERGECTKSMIKMPLPSEDVIAEIKSNEAMKPWRLDGTEKLIMFHTRAQTQGSSANNDNNMPIFSKHFVLIHNGVISTPRDNTKYKYRGEVDSEEILAQIELGGWAKAMRDLRGGMAIAIKPFSGKSIYVFRRSNPLHLVYDHKDNVLYGASIASYVPRRESDNIRKSLFEPEYATIELPQGILHKVSMGRREIKAIGYDYKTGESNETK